MKIVNISYGDIYSNQIAQAERCFGELRALVAMNYDSTRGSDNNQYKEMKNMVEDFITEFKDNFC